MWQRPQHILSRATASYQVLFWEEPIIEARSKPALSISRGRDVTIITPMLPHETTHDDALSSQTTMLRELLGGEIPAVLWFYTAAALAFAHDIQAELLVYDNMDELSLFRGASPSLVALEKSVARQS